MERNNLTMKKIFRLAVLALTIISCQQAPQEPAAGSKLGFAFSFFKNVVAQMPADDNVSVSPYSAGVALSMLSDGAEGQTRDEFQRALCYSRFADMDLGCNDTLTVTSANSVWVDDCINIKKSYAELLEEDYSAYITSRDFADPATLKAINDWCADNTEGMIDNIMDRLEPGMVMVLANALYFKAPWLDDFDPSLTEDADFYGSRKTSKVPFMSKRARMNYAEYQGCQVVELPYEGGSYSLMVVLPPKSFNLNQLIPYMSESLYRAALPMFSHKEVILKLPKVRLETDCNLNKALQKMGVMAAYTPAADFSGISSAHLVLDQVKQKCVIDISEKGTEAAAVTHAQMKLTAVRPNTVMPVKMTVDRPYLLFVVDKENENILFASKVMNL